MFNQTTNKGNVDDLVNFESPQEGGWSFDKTSLMITNKLHWRGFIPDPKLPEIMQPWLDDGIIDWAADYLEGFWKEFHKPGQNVRGNLNIYLTEKNKDLKIIPEQIDHEIYGDVIKLTYPKLPMVSDLIKVINENNIIGKVFLSFPPLYPDLELSPFVMTKEYSAEWMDKYDHARIIKEKPTIIDLEETLGYWALRIVKKSLLSPVIKVFHFQENKTKDYTCKNPPFASNEEEEKEVNDKDKNEKTLKEELLKDLPWLDEGDEIQWTNSTYKINENFMIGTLISSPVNDNMAVQSEHIEEISEGKRGYVIRYTLSTVAGSWIRDQD